MHELIDSTISYLKGLKKRYVFGSEEPAIVPDEKPLILAAPPPSKIHIAPPPKPIEISLPTPPLKKTKIELAPLPPTVTKAAPQTDILKKIGANVAQTPLDDARAKEVRFAHQKKKRVPEIPILFSGSVHKPFLESVARAISAKFGPSRILQCAALEQQQKWDVLRESESVRLYLLPDFVLAQFEVLQKGFVEKKKNRFLFGKPVLLLPDLSLYEKDPKLKRSLWNMLCTMLSQ